MRYQIVCTTREKSNELIIDKLGFVQEGRPIDRYQYIEDKEKINARITNNDSFFFTDVDGIKVEVIAVESEYVRTKPDDTKNNNLLHLRICRP